MSTVDSAPPSTPLELMDANPALFMMRDKDVPSTVTLPGSSDFELSLFNVVVTGTVEPSTAGTLVLTLYGNSKTSVEKATSDPATWLALASSVAEPVGGPDDPLQTMWMIEGYDLMVFTGSGKMQGQFKSNVADNPLGPGDLAHNPIDITDSDPLYIFAVGAAFTPTGTPPADEPICTLEIASFAITA